MNGTGVGFSVERQEVSKLPRVSEEFYELIQSYQLQIVNLVGKTFKELVGLLYIVKFQDVDLTKVRPAGAPLKTFGGRALAFPEPLENLFNFTVNTFKNAHGRQLSSIECHDIVCKIAEIVVVGWCAKKCVNIIIKSIRRQNERCKVRSMVGTKWSEVHLQTTLRVIQRNLIWVSL